jgi:RND family efflux transporter MFP subunit
MKRVDAKVSVLAIALISSVASLSGCGGNPVQAQQSQPSAVTVQRVEPQTVSRASEYVARLESREAAAVRPQVSGVVARIYVRAGDSVTTGVPLLLIDPARQQAAVGGVEANVASTAAGVEAARASLRALEAQRVANESALRLAEQQFRRYSQLYEQGVVSKELYDQNATALDGAKAAVGVVDEQMKAQRAVIEREQRTLDQARASVAEQRVSLGYYTVEAGIAGTVGDLPVKVGDYVTPADVVTTVTQNQQLELNVSVPVERAAELRRGTTVRVVDAGGQELGEAEIFFVAPEVADGTQSVLAKAVLRNESGRARADQLVRARVVWASESALTVPTTSVVRVGAQSFVWVVENGSEGGSVARQRAVTLGEIDGNVYVVRAGLEAGEAVVTSGVQRLADGAPVTIEG